MISSIYKIIIGAIIYTNISCKNNQSDCKLEFDQVEVDTIYNKSTIQYIYFITNFEYSNTCYNELIEFNKELRSRIEVNPEKTYSFTYLNNNSEMKRIIINDNYFNFTSADFNDFIVMKSNFCKKENRTSTALWKFGDILEPVE